MNPTSPAGISPAAPGVPREDSPSPGRGAEAELSERLGAHLAAARAAARVPEDQESTALWQRLEREARSGKRLRPRLLLRAARLLSADRSHGLESAADPADLPPADRDDGVVATGPADGTARQILLDAACGVELLHQAFLLHDDVIDEDLARRGLPNVYGAFTDRAREAGAGPAGARGYGRSAAILAGDLLLAQAHQVLARLDVSHPVRLGVLDALGSAVADSAAGELADAWAGSGASAPSAPAVSLPEWLRAEEHQVLRVLDQKTAAYSFRLPLVLAGILTGGSPGQIEDLARAGTSLGLIYQIRDDVLGTFGDPARTGKSTTADLRGGKLTLLVLGARSHPEWGDAAGTFGSAELTEEQAEGLRAVIRRSGALERTEEVSREHRAAMGRDLEASALPPALVRDLLELADYAQERDA